MGPPRHLALLGGMAAETVEWPVPFADGLPMLRARRGRRVVVLASGDPFWHGAGSVLARAFERGEWRALPGPSTFSLAAARMGWALESALCLALHAAPLGRLRPHLAPGARVIVLLRDGAAVGELCAYLDAEGYGASALTVLEALGGPRERVRTVRADAPPSDAAAPVAAAIEMAGPPGMPCAGGRPDALFETDGQITKRPIRALALSALAPRPGEMLWDVGGGSGSVSVEWLLSHPATEAACIEVRADRAARIRRNADRLGADRLRVVEGAAPEALEGLPPPQAVFVGGGLSESLLDDLTARAAGARLVAHAVTLESEALLVARSARHGGDLMRVEVSETAPLGPKRGWRAAHPVVQWRTVL